MRAALASTALFAFLAVVPQAGAHAQGADTGSGLTQSRRGATQEAGQADKKAPVVHVGAGTTNATTTGYSGKTKSSETPPGQLDVPPVPDASLCESYKDGPSYQGCLGVVLRQKGPAQ